MGRGFQDAFKDGVNLERWFFADGYANGQPFLVGWSKHNRHISEGALKLDLRRDIFQDPGSESGKGHQYPYTSGELRSHGFYGAGCYSVCMSK